MRRYGPARGRRVNKGRVALLIVIVAVIAVLIGWLVYTLTADNQEPEEVDTEAVFEPGVSVGGISVAGLNLDEARIVIVPAISNMMNKEMQFSVPDSVDTQSTDNTEEDSAETEGEDNSEQAEAPQDTGARSDGQTLTYSYLLEEFGVSIDPEPQLLEALAFKRDPAVYEDEEAVIEPVDFPLEYTVDSLALGQMIEQLCELDEWDTAPVNSSYGVQKSSDEEALTTGGTLVRTEPADGYEVKKETLVSDITAQIQSGTFMPVEAQTEVIPSNASKGEEKELYLMGRAQTSFKDSTSERRYNIWKMSDILNGSVFYPGEEFSVNDVSGDRNAQNGWKEGLGIEDGQYTPQYGGGICQVSTTMYNAAVKAEMDIIKRVPHTIAAKYVPKGMDATISTGGPDFVVKNPLDSAMYMIIHCDNSSSLITVEIYGTKQRDYYVELYNELISDPNDPANVTPPTQYKVNAELGPYEIKRVRAGQPYEQWQIYARHINSETDEVMEEGIKVTTSTYKAIPPLYEIGPAVPMPAEGTPYDQVKAAADAAAAAVNAPVPEPVVPEPDPVQGPEDTVPPDQSTGGAVVVP